MDNLIIIFILIVILIVIVTLNGTWKSTVGTITAVLVSYIIYTNKEGFLHDNPNYEIIDTEGTGKNHPEEVLAITACNADPISKCPDKDVSINSMVDELFSEEVNAAKPMDGDSRLGARMQYMQEQSCDAILHRSRMTSDNFRQQYQEELDQHENRRWWDHDDLDEFMVKDGVDYSLW